jgi:hypothetical protein
MLKYHLKGRKGTRNTEQVKGERAKATSRNLSIIDYFRHLIMIVFIFYLKHKALRLHRKYNCQVFIIKFRGKILIISKKQFKQMRQHKVFPKAFTAESLKRIALYYTPPKRTNNKQAIKNNDKKRI